MWLQAMIKRNIATCTQKECVCCPCIVWDAAVVKNSILANYSSNSCLSHRSNQTFEPFYWWEHQRLLGCVPSLLSFPVAFVLVLWAFSVSVFVAVVAVEETVVADCDRPRPCSFELAFHKAEPNVRGSHAPGVPHQQTYLEA